MLILKQSAAGYGTHGVDGEAHVCERVLGWGLRGWVWVHICRMVSG